MPWGGLYCLGKGPLMYAIEQSLNELDWRAQEGLARQLDDQPSRQPGLIDILGAAGLGRDTAGYRHLNDHWLSPSTGWWPHLQPIEPLIRHGMAQAIRTNLASVGRRGRPVPFALYTLCGPDIFEVVFALCTRLEGRRKVATHMNLFFVTPPIPEGGNFENLTRFEDIWVVRGQVRQGESLVERGVRKYTWRGGRDSVRDPLTTVRLRRGRLDPGLAARKKVAGKKVATKKAAGKSAVRKKATRKKTTRKGGRRPR